MRRVGLLSFALAVSSCDAARTDPAFWDRSPDLRRGDASAPPAGNGSPIAGELDDGGTGAPPSEEAPASTACARVEVTTVAYGGEYAPENVGAVWVTAADGAFVRTIEVWGSKRRKHILAWLAASNGDDIDAVSGATRKTAGAHLAAWDCRAANGAAVGPGSYFVHAEVVEENAAEGAPPGPHAVLPFEITASTVTAATAPAQASLRDLRIAPLP